LILKDYQDYFFSLLQPYDGYDKLILDVRNTKGYDDILWQEVILPIIINEDLRAEYYGVFKGERLKNYYESIGLTIHETKDLDPEKYKTAGAIGAPYVYREIKSVQGAERNIEFKDKYLIVDRNTYGAGVRMADFVHRTHTMTTIGQRTRPRQITFEPMLYDLPSGYILYLDGILGVNEDQSLNVFQGLEVDYTVEYLNVIEDGIDKAIKFILDL
jgi:hypothetical protein